MGLPCSASGGAAAADNSLQQAMASAFWGCSVCKDLGKKHGRPGYLLVVARDEVGGLQGLEDGVGADHAVAQEGVPLCARHQDDVRVPCMPCTAPLGQARETRMPGRNTPFKGKASLIADMLTWWFKPDPCAKREHVCTQLHSASLALPSPRIAA